MSGALAVGVAATRALSTFVTGKLVLIAFGAAEFGAHAQLLQLVAMVIPASCGFLSLAISSAVAAGDTTALARASRLSLLAGVASSVLPLLALVLWGTNASAGRLFGIESWWLALAALPAGMLAAIAVSRYSALLIGAGEGRQAALVDAVMAAAGMVAVAFATWRRQDLWLMLSPLFTLGCGALAARLAWARTATRLQRQPPPAAKASAARQVRLRSYVLTGLAASALGPAIMIFLRSNVLDTSGALDMSAFVAAQRLAALVTAPVPVYVYMFVTAFFAASTAAEAALRVRHLQWRIGGGLVLAFGAVCAVLPWIVPLVFSSELRVPASVFVLAAAGEGTRAVAAIQAQYVATQGHWRKYLAADGVYFASLIGSFMLGPSTASGLASAYAVAGLCYLISLKLLDRPTHD